MGADVVDAEGVDPEAVHAERADPAAQSAPTQRRRGPRGHRRVVREGTERPGDGDGPAPWDEPAATDTGTTGRSDSNDARLAEDVPPHW